MSHPVMRTADAGTREGVVQIIYSGVVTKRRDVVTVFDAKGSTRARPVEVSRGRGRDSSATDDGAGHDDVGANDARARDGRGGDRRGARTRASARAIDPRSRSSSSVRPGRALERRGG